MTSRRTALLALLALALGACRDGEAIPEVDLAFEVDVGETSVEVGRGFPLTVTRVHAKSLAVRAWDEALLAPLRLVLESESVTEDSVRVRSVRRYRAFAFTTKDIRIPAPKLVAKAPDGSTRIVRADTVRLRVRPTLAPDDDSAPELPGAPAAPARTRAPWILAGLAIAILLGGAALRRRARTTEVPPPAVVEPPGPTPEEEALGRLAALRTAPRSVAQRVAEAADVVRDYVAARFGLAAREMTTEEIVAAAPSEGAGLARVLSRCDLVKFAGREAEEADLARLIDDAATVVGETRA